MGKRYLNELSDFELRKVVEVNPKLKNELIEYYISDEDFWVNEKLSYLTVDGVVLGYSINPYERSYIDFDKDKALTSLGNIHNYIEAFGCDEKTQKVLDEALEYLTFYEQSLIIFNDTYKPNYTHVKIIQNDVYDMIWDFVKTLSKMIVKNMVDGYDYNDDTIIEALHRLYIDEENDVIYVKDDTYIAFKEVPLHEVSYER